MSDSSPARKRKRSPSRSRSRSRSRSDRSPPRKRRDRSRSRDRRRSRSRSTSRERRRNDSRRDDRNIKSEPNREDRRNDRDNRDNGRRDNNRNNNKDDASKPFFKKRSHDIGEESDIPESEMEWGKAQQAAEQEEEQVEKEQPNFKPSGALDKEQKTVVNGVELNYFEPKDAKVPTKVYVLYPFKGNEALDPLYLRKSSFFLLGRDRTIVDIPLDHPSCSKQHSVIQFRQRTMENEFGEKKAVVRPYIIDLKSTNGTHLNGTRIDDSRYFELKHKDVLKFGFSSREFVFMDESAV